MNWKKIDEDGCSIIIDCENVRDLLDTLDELERLRPFTVQGNDFNEEEHVGTAKEQTALISKIRRYMRKRRSDTI